MANYLDSLIDRIEDDALRTDLIREIASLRNRKDFGLVFERHLPETVRLYSHPVKVGVTVQERSESGGPLWSVRKLAKGKATIDRREGDEVLSEVVHAADLVVVREFGDAIYPGLTSLGRIERGGANRPFSTVIRGENYHALETLLYGFENQIDCIYIDPPYNTGAPDWKYNNRYVDENDSFRHSKWLSFMEKRLLLAKRLLRSDDSVLMIAIDDNEMGTLSLLLDQMFRDAERQVLSIVVNPKGKSRDGRLSHTHEYILIVFIGSAAIDLGEAGGDPAEVRWRYLRREDIQSARGTKKGGPSQFYPIYVSDDTGSIVTIGDSLTPDEQIESVPEIPGCTAVFPIREDGQHMNWGLIGTSLQRKLDGGFVRVGRSRQPNQPYSISYLTDPNIKKIDAGTLLVVGHRDDGSKIVVLPGGKTERPTTVWKDARYDAGAYGTSMLGQLAPGRSFPFPKSLYAVEDVLRLVVATRPDAVVLDFFAGSGTTTHAIARLNQRDGGQRQSISVTNNEVSEKELKALAERGLHPGDSGWEAEGIFEHITMPRITAAVTGKTAHGVPVEGEYKFVDEGPMSAGFEENVEFFCLEYLDRDTVSLGRSFEAVAPLLWLKAGAVGPRIDTITKPWALPDGAVYGVLFDPQDWGTFVHAVHERADSVRHVFVVTDSTSVFQQVMAELPAGIEGTMLYEDYLSTFSINTGGVRS